MSAIGDFFKNLWGTVKTLFAKAAVSMVGQLAESLGEIAEAAVGAVQDLDLTSSEKRQAAFDKINTEARAQGKIVTNAAINLAIELAVAVLKSGA